MDNKKSVTVFVGLLLFLLVGGTLGYSLILEVPFVDALYRLAENTRDFSHECSRLRARGAF